MKSSELGRVPDAGTDSGTKPDLHRPGKHSLHRERLPHSQPPYVLTLNPSRLELVSALLLLV